MGEIRSEFLNEIPSVPSSAINPTPTSKPELSIEFSKPAKNFWGRHQYGKYSNAYNSGEIHSSFNKKRLTIESVFDIFLSAIRATVEHSAQSKDIDVSSLQNHYKNLKLAETLYSERVDELLKKDVDMGHLLSYIHGMINSLIDKNITKE